MVVVVVVVSNVHTHTHTQPFYSSVDFVQDNAGTLVPEETFSHSVSNVHILQIQSRSFRYHSTNMSYQLSVPMVADAWIE